jgi:hypothetical protein
MYHVWSTSIEGCYAVKIWPLNLWPWKSIGFQILLRTKYVPSLVKIHWRMLILECSQRCYVVKMWPLDHWRMLILDCSQGCYAVKMWPLDLWPWKSIGFQTLRRTIYVPSLVKIYWRMLILEFLQRCYAEQIWPNNLDLWPMTLEIKRIPDSSKD